MHAPVESQVSQLGLQAVNKGNMQTFYVRVILPGMAPGCNSLHPSIYSSALVCVHARARACVCACVLAYACVRVSVRACRLSDDGVAYFSCGCCR